MTVRLAGGRTTQGRVERSSPDLDLAVVRTTARPDEMQILQLGSARVRPGQEVLAIGSPLGTAEHRHPRHRERAPEHRRRRADSDRCGDQSGQQRRTAARPRRPGHRRDDAEALARRRVDSASPSRRRMPCRSSKVGRSRPVPAPPRRRRWRLACPAAPRRRTARRDGEVSSTRARCCRSGPTRSTAQWRRLRDNCPIDSSGRRRPARLVRRPRSRADVRRPTPHARSFFSNLAQLATQFGARDGQVGEAARRAGVYPGTLREMRRRYRLDWSGWER